MVSEELVEASWQEIGGLEPERARKYMQRIDRQQRALLAFVTTMTEDLSVDAQEIAVYIFVVVHRMFERASPAVLPKAKPNRIAALYEKNVETFERLEGAHERFLEPHAFAAVEAEPHVMRYVVEALMEPDEDSVALSDDETGTVFLCLKTVVEVLHELSTPRQKS